MQILIMRHGEAAVEAPSDAQRPLTLCGEQESAEMARWLCQQKIHIEKVLVSPYLRAEQTLSVVKQHLALPVDREVMPELTPNGRADCVVSYLEALAGQGVASVLIISHLPLVGYLVSELCPEEAPPMFPTSGIAQVTLEMPSALGKLDWKISPCQLP